MNATAFLEEELEKVQCPMKLVMQFAICLEETFVNIAHYAYQGKEGTITLILDEEDGLFSVTLEDEGIPFNPLDKKDPDTTLSVEERQIGGLGIYMVKRTMDFVSYEYKDGKNIFHMKRILNKGELDYEYCKE